jgi:hypothetical protein
MAFLGLGSPSPLAGEGRGEGGSQNDDRSFGGIISGGCNCDHLSKLKFSPVLPYAFTEHGAIMAASALNTPRAMKGSHAKSQRRRANRANGAKIVDSAKGASLLPLVKGGREGFVRFKRETLIVLLDA